MQGYYSEPNSIRYGSKKKHFSRCFGLKTLQIRGISFFYRYNFIFHVEKRCLSLYQWFMWVGICRYIHPPDFEKSRWPRVQPLRRVPRNNSLFCSERQTASAQPTMNSRLQLRFAALTTQKKTNSASLHF